MARLLPLLAMLVLCSCSRQPGTEIRVFAAAALADAVPRVDSAWAGGAVKASFGASSDLARQVKEGAPADLFVSADRAWADEVVRAGRASGEPVAVAATRLVCVAPPESELSAKSAPELTAPGVRRIAVAGESVPAGRYAREALGDMGLLEVLNPKLVGQPDVRAVLRAVASGEVDAGIVYAGDLRAAKVKLLFEFDPTTHSPVRFWAVVLKDARPGTDELLAFLRS
ncbi:MAG: molybdate ABC transporter substrate-binding protein, partial [Planctomycetes bacterium]|nr:molybdate ABC transporter substrate-binding protein [Planctomycetota bacterium]